MEKTTGGLVQMREVLVFNTPKQIFYKFNTTSDKWSEIAEMIMNEPTLEVSSLKNMRAVIQGTKSTLELPNAVIPEGPQKIFLYENKVKSGAKKATIELYEPYSYNELRRLAKDKNVASGLGSNPSRIQLIDALEKVSGVVIKKEVKTTKSGRTKEVIIKEVPNGSDVIIKADREILSNQPNLEDRIAAMEGMLSNLIEGLYKLTKDYIAPEKPKATETKVGDVSVEQLAKEAKELAI